MSTLSFSPYFFFIFHFVDQLETVCKSTIGDSNDPCGIPILTVLSSPSLPSIMIITYLSFMRPSTDLTRSASTLISFNVFILFLFVICGKAPLMFNNNTAMAFPLFHTSSTFFLNPSTLSMVYDFFYIKTVHYE